MNFKKKIVKKPKEPVKILHDADNAALHISTHLLSIFPTFYHRPIVFVCIGTDRSTGDALGPLVGSLLEEKHISNFHIYGTLEDPIHAVNLTTKLKEITDKHVNPYIIGIDACLGRIKSVGSIQIGKGPIKPGAGVNKELPEVGDMHITGIVNVSGFMEYFVLQNTRLHLVLNMAKIIADGIAKASLSFPIKQTWTKLYIENEHEEKTP
ncbi:spore protease YyaC [Bacillus spongiae]|uniref:Spore protease YyaC n=1 Tax=Bacillus spongiae TaxID=2683610 RepID=A0ABU8HG92_9BACI